MEDKEIKTIGIVGAGVMGSGIAQLAAQAGFEVILNDINSQLVWKGMNKISQNLEKLVQKGKLEPEQKEFIFERILDSVDLKTMKDADFIIEAVVEKEDVKCDVFKRLDEICPKEVILATNTSSIPIFKMAKATKRQAKVIGLHFMNPPTTMPLVEVIRAGTTSEKTFKIAWDLCQKLGKTPLEVKKDSPGFIVNRILFPMLNEAAFAVWEGLGDPETIDKAMKLGAGYNMGPLEIADLIGLDVCLNILETLYQEFNNPKYKPCPLWKDYIDTGRLGRKTGKGFYSYEKK